VRREKRALDPSTESKGDAPHLSTFNTTNPETVNFDEELLRPCNRTSTRAIAKTAIVRKEEEEDPTRRSKPSTSFPPVLARTLLSTQLTQSFSSFLKTAKAAKIVHVVYGARPKKTSGSASEM
jgi:hypothetical protein